MKSAVGDGVLLCDAETISAVLTPNLVLAAAREAVSSAQPGLVTGRVQVNAESSWMRVLAGVVPALDLVGFKEFHRVDNKVHYEVHLFRESTGEKLAVLDGRPLTSLRTSAVAATAVAHRFSRHDELRVGMIGSGEEAAQGLRAVLAVAAVRRCMVWSPTKANRDRFARELGEELDIDVVPAESAAAALASADLGYVATASTSPFLKADDVSELPMVVAIGSTRPEQREMTGEAVSTRDPIVVDAADAWHESGDLLEAARCGVSRERVTLAADWLAGGVGTGERVLFKSVGSVEQDLVLGYRLLEAVRRAGGGVEVPRVASLRVMRA